LITLSNLLLLSSIISITITILILALIANYLYKQIIKPLGNIASQAETVSKGDYSQSIDIVHSGDLGRLERDLKLISERIKRAMQELDMDG